MKNSNKLLQEAFQYFQRNDLISAENLIQQCLSINKSDVDAIHILGLIKGINLQPHEAVALLKNAATLRPNDPTIQFNLAKVLMDLKLHSDAIRHLENCVRLGLRNVGVFINYGAALNSLGRYQEALNTLDIAINLSPNDSEIFSNRGVALSNLKNYSDAIVAYDKALELNPKNYNAQFNKALLFDKLSAYQDALSNYELAIHINPKSYQSWSNSGIIFNSLKLYSDAIACFNKAIKIKPDFSDSWINIGTTYTLLGSLENALHSFSTALEYDPAAPYGEGLLAHIKAKMGLLNDLPVHIIKVSNGIVSNQHIIQPFALLSLVDDPSLQKKSSEIYVNDRHPLNSSLGSITKNKISHKVKVGYFSPDFRKHAVAFLTSELYQTHDRSQFEIYAFSFQEDVESDDSKIHLQKSFDHYINVENMSDIEVAKFARDLGIDIAVDLAGHTNFSRLGIFSYRAAPIQVNWLGYPGTLGAQYIDYIIADHVLIPDDNQIFYTEKIAYLPNTYIVDDSKRLHSSRIFSKAECGLPEASFIFCSFNNDYKFSSLMLDSWSRILKEAIHSVLWISENNEHFKKNISSQFESRGIDPERIIFAKRLELMNDHLARYSLADLFLDTHPYNAHTTGIDALKMGVPIITLLGNSFPSRVAASLLNAVELPELITASLAEYEALAIDLANNPHKFISIRQKLKQNLSSTPLFNTGLFTKNIEAAYLQMYERHQSGHPPSHLLITN